jgi:predicted nucleic acid-binding protein
MNDLDRMGRASLAVCEAVLVEACFHLPHDSQRRRLRATLDRFQVTPLPDSSDPSFWNDVLNWLLKYSDQEPDWADGCIAVLCGREKKLRVWTYDREFRTTWRTPAGKPIPLAFKRDRQR